MFEERLPRNSGVGRFPHASSDRAKIENIRIADDAGHRLRAPSAERANEPPFHSRERIFFERLAGGGKSHSENANYCSNESDPTKAYPSSHANPAQKNPSKAVRKKASLLNRTAATNKKNFAWEQAAPGQFPFLQIM